MSEHFDITKLHQGTDGFFYDDYLTPEKPEIFVGKFMSATWYKKRPALICDFITTDGRKIALFAFWKETGVYTPSDGVHNFKEVETGTMWECEVRQSRRTGRCYWASAKQL